MTAPVLSSTGDGSGPSAKMPASSVISGTRPAFTQATALHPERQADRTAAPVSFPVSPCSCGYVDHCSPVRHTAGRRPPHPVLDVILNPEKRKAGDSNAPLTTHLQRV